MHQKWIITQEDLKRWLKPEVYHIYTNKHDELYLKDTQRFNQRFKDDRDFFISFFKNCLYYTKPEADLQSYFKDNVNSNDVLFVLNLYYENNKIVDFYINGGTIKYPNYNQFAESLEYILLSNTNLKNSNQPVLEIFDKLGQELIDYAKSQLNNLTRQDIDRKNIDNFYKNPTNQKNFILKHFSMKTLNNRTIKYKNIKIDNDLIREFMKVRYDYDTESIVRDQRSRSKDDEYSM